MTVFPTSIGCDPAEAQRPLADPAVSESAPQPAVSRETGTDGAVQVTASGTPAHMAADNAQLRDQLRRMGDDLAALQLELTAARTRPGRLLREYFRFRIFSWLSRQSPPLSEAMAARLARSAAKRRPDRDLPESLRVDLAQTVAEDDVEAGTPGSAGSALLREYRCGGVRPHDPDLSTILVVSHECSRTGAPILALNLVRTLAERYNVVSVVLGGGPLMADFSEASVAVYRVGWRGMGKARARPVLAALCASHGIRYALVNSISSYWVLPSLKAVGVPTVALVHEFASYIRPLAPFMELMDTADQVVFSTRLTLEDALRETGRPADASLHVLAQGKCAVPGAQTDEAERAWLDTALRPDGYKGLVVLGAGTVGFRKGVDLFIACAARVAGDPAGEAVRFVWIGDGYDPEGDRDYSAYLRDQIDRAGLHDRVAILNPSSEIEHAQAVADIFLLTSRLDPLPNVAIDALTAGRPVLCFERTTGIADFLEDAGLGSACVARYLDPSDMAQKILRLADDAPLRAVIGAQARDRALRVFDFTSYAATLDAIALPSDAGRNQPQPAQAAMVAGRQIRPDQT